MKDKPDGQKTAPAHAAAAKRHASAGPRGLAFQPPAYGIGALDAIQPQSDQDVIQRMSVGEVNEVFDESDLSVYSNGLAPTAQVVKAISQLTSAWESMGKNIDHRRWRKEFLKTQFSRVLGYKTSSTFAQAQKFCQDVDYWKALLLVWFENGADRFKPDVNQILGQHSRLKQITGLPPTSQRIHVKVTMGQGAAGDLKKFIFFSSQFHSCSAVAMYNAGNDKAGLFHYAAKDAVQHQKLMEMALEIEPTLVAMYVHTAEDLAVVQDLFDPLPVQAFKGRSGQYYLYLSPQGQPTFTPDDPGGAGAYLNLSGGENIPDELLELPVSLYHEPQTYTAGFEIFPYHG